MLATKFGNLMKDGQIQQRGDPAYVKYVSLCVCSASGGPSHGAVCGPSILGT